MARNLIPYGLLPNGNYGINLNNTTNNPDATVLEVLDTLPPVASQDNADGRLVFSKADATIFVFVGPPTLPTAVWVPLEGVPASVGNSTGVAPFDPPIAGSEVAGELYWTLDTEVLFVWDGLQWQAAGGRYATQVIEKSPIQIGDGVNVVFPAGITSSVPAEYVEVFIDGVRQVSLDTDPGSGDYVIVGTNVVFTLAPVPNAEVFIRSMQSVQVVQNTQITERIYTANLTDTNFGTGIAGTDPNGVLVSVNGSVQIQGAAEDYVVSTSNTTIASISKAFPGATTAVVVTNAPHGITTIGTAVTLSGIELDNGGLDASQDATPPPPQSYNDSFVVSSIGSVTDFDITVPAATPANIDVNVPNPGDNVNMFFDPPFFEDEVVFNTPMSGSERVYIKSFKNLIVAPSQGEANDIVLRGTAAGFNLIPIPSKIGVDLQIKGINAGSNISITDTGDDLIITASTGANFENRGGYNGGLIVPGDTISYVGVLDTIIAGPSIVVDLSGSGPGGGTPTPGRKITIKDEGGLAGTLRNIEITGPFGATFDGNASPYVISADSGSVTLVLDSSNNWNTTAEYNGVRTFSGSGSPEGVVIALPGSMYTNNVGGAGTTLYVKESGTGNTGWVAK